MLNLNDSLNILCLGAHCDDIEIGCGGSILKLISSKHISHAGWIVFSSNETRKKEAKNSAEKFLKDSSGFTIDIYDFRDGFFPAHFVEIKEKFEQIKKTMKPDIIFTHYRLDRHQDHRIISDLTWNTFRNHLILEYEVPKWDGDIGNPNIFVDIPEEIVVLKNKILNESFISQADKHWFSDDTFNSLLRLRGIESNSKYAEAFYGRKVKIE